MTLFAVSLLCSKILMKKTAIEVSASVTMRTMLVNRRDTNPVAFREHLASIDAISSQHTLLKPYVSCGCASDGCDIGKALGTIVVGSWHHPVTNSCVRLVHV